MMNAFIPSRGNQKVHFYLQIVRGRSWDKKIQFAATSWLQLQRIRRLFEQAYCASETQARVKIE